MLRLRSVLTLHAQALIAAFQFLSVLPIRKQVPFTPPVLTRSVVYYPVVGAVIGLLLAFAAILLPRALPVPAAAALLLAAWVGLTGALHLDGWMDTADGLLSRQDRERALEIMKDSRVGAMGAVAGMLLLLVKFSLIVSLLEAPEGWLALAVAPVWSRWWMVHAIACWPYARAGSGSGGLGSLFREVKRGHSLAAGLLALAATALILAGTGSWPAAPSFGAIGWLASLPLATLLAGGAAASYIGRRLGGQTGDTYGAMNEGVETFLLLVWAAARHGGMMA